MKNKSLSFVVILVVALLLLGSLGFLSSIFKNNDDKPDDIITNPESSYYLEEGATYIFNDDLDLTNEKYFGLVKPGLGQSTAVAYPFRFVYLDSSTNENSAEISNLVLRTLDGTKLQVIYGNSIVAYNGSSWLGEYKTITITELSMEQYLSLSPLFLEWFESVTTKITTSAS